jgi:hypothetical protein
MPSHSRRNTAAGLPPWIAEETDACVGPSLADHCDTVPKNAAAAAPKPHATAASTAAIRNRPVKPATKAKQPHATATNIPAVNSCKPADIPQLIGKLK